MNNEPIMVSLSLLNIGPASLMFSAFVLAQDRWFFLLARRNSRLSGLSSQKSIYSIFSPNVRIECQSACRMECTIYLDCMLEILDE